MRGIDVAKWNVISSYSKLRGAGVEFAIPKVININNKQDSSLYAHVAGFRAAGIPCNMGYTYSYANTTAKAASAAQAFIDVAKGVDINYMWLDLEDACMRGLGHKLIDIIDVYEDVAVRNGFKFGIYTYSSYYNSYIRKYISELGGVPFWIARYPFTKNMAITDGVPSNANLPNGIAVSGWQYSSKGVIDGAKGYLDLNVWYDDCQQVNDVVVTIEANPFVEPVSDCMVGTIGNDANWCLWYLWRFGKLVDATGKPDSSKINNLYSKETAELVNEVQRMLGLVADGIVGKQTRAVFKKLA